MTGEFKMISKDSFVKIMNSLRDYNDELCKDMKRLGVVFDNYLTTVICNVLNAISEDLESNLDTDEYTDTWCNYYAFELDFGRDKMAIDCVDIGDTTYSLQTAEQLYDLITLLNEKRLNDKQEHK